jgi:hypothetical protein
MYGEVHPNSRDKKESVSYLGFRTPESKLHSFALEPKQASAPLFIERSYGRKQAHMQKKRKVIGLIEPQASNIDATTQKAILSRYAHKHKIKIDKQVGQWAPESGAAGEPEHLDLLNDIEDGGVERLLVLADVKHAIPEEIFAECRKAHVKVDLIDVQQEQGLTD